MPAPLLASAAELSRRVGRPANDMRLLGALQDASRRFRGAVHHEVSRVVDDELELDGAGSRFILLPARPVVSIASLVLADDDATELVAGTDYSIRKREGILRRLSGRVWPNADAFATLTYTHGYDAAIDPTDGSVPGLPEDIQAAVLDMAQILLNVEPGVQSKTVLGDTVAFGASSATGVTQVWSDAVANHILHRGDRA